MSARDLAQPAVETQRRRDAASRAMPKAHRRLPTSERSLAGFQRPDEYAREGMRLAREAGDLIMLKRVAVLALLAPLTLGNLSKPVEAAGWGPLAALVVAAHLPIAPEAGWRHGGGFRRGPYYPRPYGGFYRPPYYSRYSGAF
jgi:hypothetical protein